MPPVVGDRAHQPADPLLSADGAIAPEVAASGIASEVEVVAGTLDQRAPAVGEAAAAAVAGAVGAGAGAAASAGRENGIIHADDR